MKADYLSKHGLNVCFPLTIRQNFRRQFFPDTSNDPSSLWFLFRLNGVLKPF